jgi:hypothetical protein
MAQNRTCNLSVTGRPSSPLRHVFKVPPDVRTWQEQHTSLHGLLPSAIFCSPWSVPQHKQHAQVLPLTKAMTRLQTADACCQRHMNWPPT